MRRAALQTVAALLKGQSGKTTTCVLHVDSASIRSERGLFKYMACEIVDSVLAREASFTYRKHRRQCVAR